LSDVFVSRIGNLHRAVGSKRGQQVLRGGLQDECERIAQRRFDAGGAGLRVGLRKISRHLLDVLFQRLGVLRVLLDLDLRGLRQFVIERHLIFDAGERGFGGLFAVEDFDDQKRAFGREGDDRQNLAFFRRGERFGERRQSGRDPGQNLRWQARRTELFGRFKTARVGATQPDGDLIFGIFLLGHQSRERIGFRLKRPRQLVGARFGRGGQNAQPVLRGRAVIRGELVEKRLHFGVVGGDITGEQLLHGEVAPHLLARDLSARPTRRHRRFNRWVGFRKAVEFGRDFLIGHFALFGFERFGQQLRINEFRQNARPRDAFEQSREFPARDGRAANCGEGIGTRSGAAWASNRARSRWVCAFVTTREGKRQKKSGE